MAKDPALLFYTSDFLTGTTLMTNEEVGMYIRMLCILHQSGGEVDIEAFDSFVGNHPSVKSKFSFEDGKVFNKRLTNEMIKRSKKSSSLSENAKKHNIIRQSLLCLKMLVQLKLHMSFHLMTFGAFILNV